MHLPFLFIRISPPFNHLYHSSATFQKWQVSFRILESEVFDDLTQLHCSLSTAATGDLQMPVASDFHTFQVNTTANDGRGKIDDHGLIRTESTDSGYPLTPSLARDFSPMFPTPENSDSVFENRSSDNPSYTSQRNTFGVTDNNSLFGTSKFELLDSLAPYLMLGRKQYNKLNDSETSRATTPQQGLKSSIPLNILSNTKDTYSKMSQIPPTSNTLNSNSQPILARPASSQTLSSHQLANKNGKDGYSKMSQILSNPSGAPTNPKIPHVPPTLSAPTSNSQSPLPRPASTQTLSSHQPANRNSTDGYSKMSQILSNPSGVPTNPNISHILPTSNAPTSNSQPPLPRPASPQTLSSHQPANRNGTDGYSKMSQFFSNPSSGAPTNTTTNSQIPQLPESSRLSNTASTINDPMSSLGPSSRFQSTDQITETQLFLPTSPDSKPVESNPYSKVSQLPSFLTAATRSPEIQSGKPRSQYVSNQGRIEPTNPPPTNLGARNTQTLTNEQSALHKPNTYVGNHSGLPSKQMQSLKCQPLAAQDAGCSKNNAYAKVSQLSPLSEQRNTPPKLNSGQNLKPVSMETTSKSCDDYTNAAVLSDLAMNMSTLDQEVDRSVRVTPDKRSNDKTAENAIKSNASIRSMSTVKSGGLKSQYVSDVGEIKSVMQLILSAESSCDIQRRGQHKPNMSQVADNENASPGHNKSQVQQIKCDGDPYAKVSPISTIVDHNNTVTDRKSQNNHSLQTSEPLARSTDGNKDFTTRNASSSSYATTNPASYAKLDQINHSLPLITTSTMPKSLSSTPNGQYTGTSPCDPISSNPGMKRSFADTKMSSLIPPSHSGSSLNNQTSNPEQAATAFQSSSSQYTGYIAGGSRGPSQNKTARKPSKEYCVSDKALELQESKPRPFSAQLCNPYLPSQSTTLPSIKQNKGNLSDPYVQTSANGAIDQKQNQSSQPYLGHQITCSIPSTQPVEIHLPGQDNGNQRLASVVDDYCSSHQKPESKTTSSVQSAHDNYTTNVSTRQTTVEPSFVQTNGASNMEESQPQVSNTNIENPDDGNRYCQTLGIPNNDEYHHIDTIILETPHQNSLRNGSTRTTKPVSQVRNNQLADGRGDYSQVPSQQRAPAGKANTQDTSLQHTSCSQVSCSSERSQTTTNTYSPPSIHINGYSQMPIPAPVASNQAMGNNNSQPSKNNIPDKTKSVSSTLNSPD